MPHTHRQSHKQPLGLGGLSLLSRTDTSRRRKAVRNANTVTTKKNRKDKKKMNEFVTFAVLVVLVIGLACIVNKFFPPDYHRRVEEKYNK